MSILSPNIMNGAEIIETNHKSKRTISDILREEDENEESVGIHEANRPDSKKPSIMNGASQQQRSEDDFYLEYINRRLLDFDLEKICSVTLSTINVYCCLKCGKFFQGRSNNSPAFSHAIDNEGHSLFINLSNLKTFLLPDNKELFTFSGLPAPTGTLSKVANIVNEIRNLLNPGYDKNTIQQKLYNPQNTESTDLNYNKYKVGLIGLSKINNNSRNNFQNVALLLVSHLHIIRDWYLINTSPLSKTTPAAAAATANGLNGKSVKFQKNYELNLKLGLFLRKYWYDKLFKNHISPYDLLNYINKISNGIFLDDSLDNNDPKFFLNWLLNNLNFGFNSKKNNILANNIQGEIQVEEINEAQNKITKAATTKFWQITLELPDKKILSTKNVSLIEQISIGQLLASKFKAPKVISEKVSRKYTILSLPNYLILNFDRFNKNFRHNFNDIVIKYDIDSLKMGNFLPEGLASTKQNTGDDPYEYKLIANIVHDSINHQNDESSDPQASAEAVKLFNANNHSWRIQLLDQLSGEWYEVNNTLVKKINKRLIFLNESYIQVWQKKSIKYGVN